jgi:excisionase family DNA binding protein
VDLSTQQAADLLNVSHAYLIGLLDAGAIPCHDVGGQRRVDTASLLSHLRDDDLRRRHAADELSTLTRGWT